MLELGDESSEASSQSMPDPLTMTVSAEPAKNPFLADKSSLSPSQSPSPGDWTSSMGASLQLLLRAVGCGVIRQRGAVSKGSTSWVLNTPNFWQSAVAPAVGVKRRKVKMGV